MPMRVAAIYDIHANLPALEAVLAAIDAVGVDLIVVGGDVVPGPMPRETLARLRAIDTPIRFIRGNGDREVVASRRGTESAAVPGPFREAIRWNAAQLSADDEAWLAGWPATLRETVHGLGEVLFCHATPDNDTDIFTRATADGRVAPVFAGVDASLVVCGHTHMQFERKIGAVRVVNAGSVGMPFGAPGADWLLLDSTVQLRHTQFDLEEAAARIRASTYPQAEGFAAGNVLRPPSEEQILEAYSRVELREPHA